MCCNLVCTSVVCCNKLSFEAGQGYRGCARPVSLESCMSELACSNGVDAGQAQGLHTLVDAMFMPISGNGCVV